MSTLVRIALLLACILFGTIIGAMPAHASDVGAWECGAAQEMPPTHEDDPIINTRLQVVYQGDGIVGFSAEHFSASGKEYLRREQYRDRRFWESKEAAHWSGVSIRNPRITMVGTLTKDHRRRVVYIEKAFRGGRLERTITHFCRSVPFEG
jgi:hypothetical protein